MKHLIYVLFVLFVCAITNAQSKGTILHINSSWNAKNDYKDLYKLKGVKIVKASLENQSPSIRSQIKSVPVIFYYNSSGNLVQRWDADISLKIKTSYLDIQAIIDQKVYRRASTE